MGVITCYNWEAPPVAWHFRLSMRCRHLSHLFRLLRANGATVCLEAIRLGSGTVHHQGGVPFEFVQALPMFSNFGCPIFGRANVVTKDLAVHLKYIVLVRYWWMVGFRFCPFRTKTYLICDSIKKMCIEAWTCRHGLALCTDHNRKPVLWGGYDIWSVKIWCQGFHCCFGLHSHQENAYIDTWITWFCCAILNGCYLDSRLIGQNHWLLHVPLPFISYEVVPHS